MAVKTTDKFAVIISYAKGSIDLGFESLSSVVSLVENQLEESDPSKTAEYIKEAIDGEVTVDGTTYNIVDVNTYFDVYAGDDEDEDV